VPTPNGEELRFGYPRPQFERSEWQCLNGEWEFAIDPEAVWELPEQVKFDLRIHVPYAPETPASGVGMTGFYKAVWYRRRFFPPDLSNGGRLLLRFGAVDTEATVWINGRRAGAHRGGYTPFRFDITHLLESGKPQEIVVRAEDDPLDLTKPRGKQDWQLEPHSIWYPRTTGIWQTVWMERVPATWLDLASPAGARALIIFAHGSGSGRHSPRNRFVAQELQASGLATLLLDLLTPEEEKLEEYTRHRGSTSICSPAAWWE
jgi:hypothetical protein